MRSELVNSMKYNRSLDMIYIANSGVISKRRVKVIQVDEDTFLAYCYLRQSKRTFKIDSVLALVPNIQYESMVV